MNEVKIQKTDTKKLKFAWAKPETRVPPKKTYRIHARPKTLKPPKLQIGEWRFLRLPPISSVCNRKFDLRLLVSTCYDETIIYRRTWSKLPPKHLPRLALRSEERRVGKERVSTFRSRWSPNH